MTGTKQKSLINDPADSTTLASNIIHYLYLDRQNRIWIVFLKQLYEVVEASIADEKLDVGMLAEKMFVSRSTLNRKLTVLLGVSANETIRKYRLKKAARLLQLGYSVAETAYSTGFKSASYFSTSFKDFYGLAPSEYERSRRTVKR